MSHVINEKDPDSMALDKLLGEEAADGSQVTKLPVGDDEAEEGEAMAMPEQEKPKGNPVQLVTSIQDQLDQLKATLGMA